jgi:hypothetical protein
MDTDTCYDMMVCASISLHEAADETTPPSSYWEPSSVENDKVEISIQRLQGDSVAVSEVDCGGMARP